MTQKAASAILSNTDNLPSDRARSRALLLNEETYAFVLLTLAMDAYPPDPEKGDQGVLGWHPTTIRKQLEQDFALTLPSQNLDKLMMAITVLTSNRFFKDVNTFIDVCNIFTGDDFDPSEFNPADPGEILWGVTEACLIYPPNNDPEDTEFSQEIRTYIAEVLQTEGIVDPPDILRLGLRGDVANRIRSEYADDPEMYSAIWEEQKGKQDDMTAMLRQNLGELALQLKVLPLKHGSVKDVLVQLGKIAQQLPKETTDG